MHGGFHPFGGEVRALSISPSVLQRAPLAGALFADSVGDSESQHCFQCLPNVLSSAIGQYDLTLVRSFFPGFGSATVLNCRKFSGQYCRSMDASNIGLFVG